jgi:probable F420-dependent oxidoreductase
VTPYRFGILTKGPASVKAWRELVRQVDDSGFSTLLVPMHSTPQFTPAAALADAAARTSLRIGTLVHNNDLQHPALLAREAATLALLSESRFELGVGAGWMERDYQQLGLVLDPGAERVCRLAEAIEIMRRSWLGQEFDFHGEHYNIESLKGLAAPSIPLLIGAGGDRMLRLAAQTASIISLSRRLSAGAAPNDVAADASLKSTERKAAAVRALLGPRAAEVELNILVVRAAMGIDARFKLDDYVAMTGVSPQTARETPENLLASSVDEAVHTLQERRARTGISYYVFRDQDLHPARMLVERLAGTT